MIDNPHEVLGVSRGASMDEIKRAYRRKAKECHPDLHPGDPTANARMQQVNEAYDMLCNPEKYASRRQTGPGGTGYGQGPYGGYGGPYDQRRRQGGGQYAYYSTGGSGAGDADPWQAWQRAWGDAYGGERRDTRPARPFRGALRLVAGLLLLRFFLSFLRFGLFFF